MIEINGEFGSGGGQVLRTALSLSCILQKPVKITNIRAKRPKPGLQAQHLTCVKALQKICNAEVKNAVISAEEITFKPSNITPGKYFFDIGTAGSITLLAQCILPVLLFAGENSEVTFIGGTHVPFSPPADYFRDVFLPTITKMGVQASFEVEQFGFYPVGGGKVVLKIQPSELKPLNLVKRSPLENLELRSFYSQLPEKVGQRQLNSMQNKLSNFNYKTIAGKKNAKCPGTFTFIKANYGNCIAGFSSLGKKGKPAEAVGEESASLFLEFDKSDACADEHLADQLLLYCALAKNSAFTTIVTSEHFNTNIETISKFLPVKIEIEKNLVSIK